MTDNLRMLPKPSTSPLALSRDGAPVPKHWVEDLFARLSAILGGAMGNVYAGADPELVKGEWAQAIAGFSAKEIQRGLAACRTRKFAPNLGEFLHLCRPALDPEVAWIEAEEGLKAHAAQQPFAWSHPAVYWAAAGMAFDIRSSSFSVQRRRWDRMLAQEFERGAWSEIPDPTARRIGQFQADPTPAERERVLGLMRETRRRVSGFSTPADEMAAMVERLAAQQEQPTEDA